ncbi:uncharacterized protein A1O9_09413 [Exophiala aquamarina CBS 119918]|uniref:Transcription factor domain-containing protein n=1 Tax=Exophiala aquamarina CBS 119918 TaxID=1182545 RepID=A0A072P3H5_9EURO|nr:uncharacterized protein A1O9_09413 [Exophiala aquamarina CBS 119918]KEF54247.1 hypothetical protein A1O9_09413 [Exophiala aquamarina CBS 119918]
MLCRIPDNQNSFELGLVFFGSTVTDMLQTTGSLASLAFSRVSTWRALQGIGFGNWSKQPMDYQYTPCKLMTDPASPEGVQNPLMTLDQPKSAEIPEVAIVNDLYLLDHYLLYGGQDSALIPHLAYAMTSGIPNLAAYHRGLLSSLLALGAACHCVNLLTDSTPTSEVDIVQAVIDLMHTADRYHQEGLEALRHDIMDLNHKNPHIAHLEAIMLFPYPLAKRRIVRLLDRLSRRSCTLTAPMIPAEFSEDSPTNLEWMVFLRGITTLGQVSTRQRQGLADDTMNELYLIQNSTLDRALSAEVLRMVSLHTQRNVSAPPEFRPLIGTKHPLYPVVSATRVTAMQKLQTRIVVLQQHTRRLQQDLFPSFEATSRIFDYSASLIACTLASDMLRGITDTVFDENAAQYRSVELDEQELNTSWLKLFSDPPDFHPDWPMRRVIIFWANCVPKQYFDLLMSPIPRVDQVHTEPSQEKELILAIHLLAWDIYVHWLAFAILIEGECWYIGDLGTSDIRKTREMLNRYSYSWGSDVVGFCETEQDYWPTAMCSIAQQLQRYSSPSPKSQV